MLFFFLVTHSSSSLLPFCLPLFLILQVLTPSSMVAGIPGARLAHRALLSPFSVIKPGGPSSIPNGAMGHPLFMATVAVEDGLFRWRCGFGLSLLLSVFCGTTRKTIDFPFTRGGIYTFPPFPHLDYYPFSGPISSHTCSSDCSAVRPELN